MNIDIKSIMKLFIMLFGLYIIIYSIFSITVLIWKYQFNIALLGLIISVVGSCILGLAFIYLIVCLINSEF